MAKASIYIPDTLYRRLAAVADSENINVSKICQEAIEKYLDARYDVVITVKRKGGSK